MHALALYAIRVHDNRGNPPLSEFAPGCDLIDYLLRYFRRSLGVYKDLPGNRMVRLALIGNTSSDRIVSGIIETGEYGFRSKLYDTEHATVSYQKSPPEAEMVPFFFLASVPQEGNVGFLVLQRFKQFGVRDFLVPPLLHDFSETYRQQRLEVERVAPHEVMEQILSNGIIKSLRFIRHSLPEDLADAVASFGATASEHEAEFIIRPKRNRSLSGLSRISALLSGQGSVSELVTLPNFAYDNVKVEVDFDGRKKTIDLGNPLRISSNIDITEDLEIGSDGHPMFNSIFAIALDMVNRHQERLNIPAIHADVTGAELPEAEQTAGITSAVQREVVIAG